MLRMKHLPLDQVNTSNENHNGTCNPVCTLQMNSSGSSFKVNITLCQFLLGPKPISLQ